MGFACYGPALGDGKCQKAPGLRARAIATTGALCSSSHGGSGAYLVVPGSGCEVEIRNAPNGTAALIFVENAEAARCVFGLVLCADVTEGGRRYHLFVLPCRYSTGTDDGRDRKGGEGHFQLGKGGTRAETDLAVALLDFAGAPARHAQRPGQVFGDGRPERVHGARAHAAAAGSCGADHRAFHGAGGPRPDPPTTWNCAGSAGVEALQT